MTKFKKISKARSITIPKDVAAHLDFDAGDAIELTASNGSLLITKHVNTCRFCGGAGNVKQFDDIFICPLCAARLYKEVCG